MRFIILVFTFLVVQLVNGQDYKHQLQLQHDNDFLFAIDRYYTTGTFFRYDKTLEGDFLFKATEFGPLQLSINLGQETYTPRELFETDFNLLERPYAGYLFSSIGLSQVGKNSLWSFEAELGLAGPQSLAGEFQVAYHELINEFIPVWEGQIANSTHINFQANYFRDFALMNSNFLKFVSLESSASLGTKTIHFSQGANLYFGKRADMAKSSAFGRLGEPIELYGFAGLTYKYVVHNALVSGHPFGDDSPFTLTEVPSVVQLNAGLTYRGLRNTFSFSYHYQTRETFREGRWQYATIKLGRKF